MNGNIPPNKNRGLYNNYNALKTGVDTKYDGK